MVRLFNVGVKFHNDAVPTEALDTLLDLFLRETPVVRNHHVGSAGVKGLLDVLETFYGATEVQRNVHLAKQKFHGLQKSRLNRLVVVIVVDVKPVRAVLLIAHGKLKNRGGEGIFRIDISNDILFHRNSVGHISCRLISDQMHPLVESTSDAKRGSMPVAMSNALANALNIASRMW